MAAMAKLPNKNFIIYLSNYGQGGSSQFDEFVAQAAHKYDIEPFEISLPRQKHYCAAIKRVIDDYQSTLILFSGRAGDGKTHFLRKLFTDPDFIGHSLEEWENSPNCFSVTTATTHGPISFTLVKDFTSNETPKVTTTLRDSIIEIMEQSAEQHQATAPAHAKCHIVIIAGNSGKIMERFQNFFASSLPSSAVPITHSKSKNCKTANVTTQSEPPQRLQQFIKALELYMLEANASKLKNFLGVQCHDMSSCLGTAEIQAIFTAITQSPYWNNCTTCQYHNFCPIVRNRRILMQPLVMQRLLQLHELMVDNGLHFTVRNVFLLFTKAILGRNTKDGDLNCNIVSYNVSRHSAQFQNDDQQALNQALMQFNLASLPFDNLFGLNASSHNIMYSSSRKKVDRDEQLTPIFRDLQTMGVGQESTKLVDELLCTGHSTDAAPLLQRAYKKLLVPYDHYALTTKLQQAYTYLQANLEYDSEKDSTISANSESDTLKQMRDLMASLRRILFFTMPYPTLETPYDGEVDTSLTPSARTNTHTTPLFNPYLLTAYPHALQYLDLKHEVQASALERLQDENYVIDEENTRDVAKILTLSPHDYCPVEISTYIDTARTLIIGLNRAFTGMMLFKRSAEEIFITTSNQLNPNAQSIIYDIDHYRIDVDFHGHKHDTCLRFECSPSNLITLVFHQSANDFAFVKGSKRAKAAAINSTEFSDKNSRLVLTPQIFEYLMSLASGQVGHSNFTSCQHNLMAFKASIDAMLSQTLNYDKKPSDLLNNVFVCQLDEAGGFAL